MSSNRRSYIEYSRNYIYTRPWVLMIRTKSVLVYETLNLIQQFRSIEMWINKIEECGLNSRIPKNNNLTILVM